MFVKPHDVPPLLCVNVQIEMRFGVEQLLFTTPTLWKQELFYSTVFDVTGTLCPNGFEYIAHVKLRRTSIIDIE